MSNPKQLQDNRAALVRLNGLNVNGSSTVITTQITAALATAGEGGTSVPLRPATAGKAGNDGVITLGATNYVKLLDSTTKADLVGTGNAEVYGRVTEAGGIYTLSYFTLQAGVQTAHTFSTAVTLDLLLPYRFTAGKYPVDALLTIPTSNVSENYNPATQPRFVSELITPTALNTLPPLSFTPTSIASLKLIVNTFVYDPFGGTGARYTLVGKQVAWDQSKGIPPFDLETTDRVVAEYLTLE